ncbi:ABC transporter permease [Paenibacillus tyrfis]|uniref:ABC transporter permease n=1 Tax=Paenibacillus tyrfis TaxID=1501230 RepID=UPI00209E58C0|nr:ABC-2 family transporter protein [Paenibacillus tyrfis]MCP1311564.1 ABC-2 family transporter protein [Paenibacillus tyrfis]
MLQLGYIRKLVMMSIQTQFAFRSAYVIQLIRELLFMMLSIQLFEAFYASTDQPVEVGIQQTVTYLVIAKFAQFFFMQTMTNVQNRIHTGMISMELLKPAPLDFVMLAQEFGSWLQKIVMITLPILIVTYFFYDVQGPQHLYDLLWFMISLLVSFVIMFYANYIVALFAFWIPYLWALNILSNTLFVLMSGASIPLWFYPDIVQRILQYTPFSLSVFAPVNIYLGNYSAGQIAQILLLQLGWMIILWLVARWIWSQSIRKIIIFGG